MHVQPSRLVKVHTPPLHDGLHLALPGIVEALSRVAGLQVRVQVKGRGGKTGFDVVAEGGGEARVDGLGDGQTVEPVVSGEVGNCGLLGMGDRRRSCLGDVPVAETSTKKVSE